MYNEALLKVTGKRRCLEPQYVLMVLAHAFDGDAWLSFFLEFELFTDNWGFKLKEPFKNLQL